MSFPENWDDIRTIIPCMLRSYSMIPHLFSCYQITVPTRLFLRNWLLDDISSFNWSWSSYGHRTRCLQLRVQDRLWPENWIDTAAHNSKSYSAHGDFLFCFLTGWAKRNFCNLTKDVDVTTEAHPSPRFHAICVDAPGVNASNGSLSEAASPWGPSTLLPNVVPAHPYQRRTGIRRELSGWIAFCISMAIRLLNSGRMPICVWCGWAFTLQTV